MNRAARRAAERRRHRPEISPAPRFVTCPDCGGSPDGSLPHRRTCPVSIGVDRIVDADRDYFESHPDETEYRRPVTWAEQVDTALTGASTPTGDVLVTQIRPGVRARHFSSAKDGGAR